MQLAELKTIVTGAAGGLGRYFVAALLEAGAAVAAGDTNAAGLRALKKETANLAGHLHIARLDVTDEAGVEHFVTEADQALAGINALINSAGILRDGLLIQKRETGLNRLSLAQWRQVLDVNLTGPFLMTRAFAALFMESQRQHGVVVNLSSLSRKGNPGQANYAASKAGLDAATRTWALELGPSGIRVGGVAPGVTETGFLEGISRDALDDLAASIPLGRFASPGEIWSAVRFVLECDYFSGRIVEVDGGARMA